MAEPIWRYPRVGGNRSHGLVLVAAGRYVSDCGLDLARFRGDDWLGDGSETERRRLASLPRCGTCIRVRRCRDQRQGAGRG